MTAYLVTIADYKTAYESNGFDAHSVLIGLRKKLEDQQRSSDVDPAWICLATEEQLAKQMLYLSSLDPSTTPLWGIPFAVKDNIDVQGWKTTAACPSFAYDPKNTAAVVQKLMAAGAVLIGKTNLDQFATGLVGTRSPHGGVPNSFVPELISGGSSSGSASVVARGIVAFSLGTDTAGSGRIPAGFNNLVGLKPTPGVLDMSGVLPACRTLDCVSIFAHTPDDAGIVYQVLSEDRQTAATRPIKFGFPRKPRVGIPDQPLFTDPLYEKGFGDAVEHMDAFATSISRFDMDTLNRVAKLLYDGPWVAERYAVIHDLITGGRPDLDSTVASVVGRGNQFTALDTFNAIYQLKDLSKTTQALWEQFDLIMVPTAPGIPSFKDVSEQPIEANSALGIYTNFVNLLGWSAIALPYCITSGGYPFGVTLIAPGGCDAALLSFAKTWLNDIGLPLGATQTYSANDAVNKINTSASTPPIWNDSILLAVVGAHLRGLPLHHELESVGAVLYSATTTSASYRLFALQGTTPAKPGLKRTESDGHSIEVEVYQIPAQNLADFISNIPSPLGIGSIELANSMWVKGFVCEPYGLENAIDVTHFGGWRAYQKSIGNG